MIQAAAFIAAVAAAAWSPAAQAPAPEGPVTHAASGMVLPATVGPFRRVSVRVYDPSGNNFSGGYDLETPQGRISATVYVYPAAGSPSAETCREEFEETKRSITGNSPVSRLLIEQNLAQPPGKEAVPGYTSTYALRRDGAELTSRADLHCFVGGRWFVKYRVTAASAIDFTPAFTAFKEALGWPRARTA